MNAAAETRRATSGDVAAPSHPVIPSSVVHELRTPLTAIHGYAQLLKRNVADPAMTQRAVEVILRESGRLGLLLRQLSEVAEIDAGPLNGTPGPTNVTNLAQSVADQVGTETDRHELAVEGGAVEGHLDARRLSQVLSHLIGNAIKYAPEGGRITVAVARQGDGVHVSITDPGIGVASEDAERIYERFYRSRNAERMGARGLGLGLYVTRQIAKSCGGRVWHEPNATGGTIFHVFLPDG